jgi:hypothetical protein
VNIRLIPIATNVALLGRGRLEFKDLKNPKVYYITPANDTTIYYRVDTSQVSEKNIREYAGSYYSDEAESKMKISAKESKLSIEQRGNQFTLSPVYKDGFSLPGGDLYFERDKRGNIVKFFISYSRARKVEFKKVSNQIK